MPLNETQLVPLQDAAPRPSYADVAKQNSTKAPGESADPNPPEQANTGQEQIVLGPAAPPELETDVAEVDDRQQESQVDQSPKETEVAAEQDQVSVRDLSIRPDGTPTDEPIAEQNEPNLEPQTDEVSEADQPGDDIDSGYVGDIDESTAEVEQPVQAPRQPLDYAGYPQQQIRLTRNVLRMRGMMQQCLRYYYQRPEIANRRSNWGMMHSIMVYGIDTKVIVGRKKYSAIAWIAGNNACRGQKLLSEQDGELIAKSGVGLQGHPGQLLAVFSLAGVPDNYTLYAGETKYNVQDLIEAEKLACKRGEELTFTLIGLAHYLGHGCDVEECRRRNLGL